MGNLERVLHFLRPAPVSNRLWSFLWTFSMISHVVLSATAVSSWKASIFGTVVNIVITLLCSDKRQSKPFVLAVPMRSNENPYRFIQNTFRAKLLLLTRPTIFIAFALLDPVPKFAVYGSMAALLEVCTLTSDENLWRSALCMHALAQGIAWYRTGHGLDTAILAFTSVYIAFSWFATVTQAFCKEADLNEEARRRLEEKSRAENMLLSKCSHEFRSLLYCISGNLEVITEGGSFSPEANMSIGVVQECSDMLLKIVNEILEVRKVQHLELTKEPITIRDFLLLTLQIQLPLAREKNLELKCTVDPDVPERIVGDQLRIRQVILGLISNAIKCSKQGVINISAKRFSGDPSFLHISCSDCGCGIPESKKAMIFQPFCDIKNGRKESTSGIQKHSSGLGLHLYKSLSQLWGGNMWFESEENKGSIFHFTLPFEDPPHPHKPRQSPLRREKHETRTFSNASTLRQRRRVRLSFCEQDFDVQKNVAAAPSFSSKRRQSVPAIFFHPPQLLLPSKKPNRSHSVSFQSDDNKNNSEFPHENSIFVDTTFELASSDHQLSDASPSHESSSNANSFFSTLEGFSFPPPASPSPRSDKNSTILSEDTHSSCNDTDFHQNPANSFTDPVISSTNHENSPKNLDMDSSILNVLIVDDTDLVARVMSRQISKLGHRVTVMRDGEDVVQFCEGNAPKEDGTFFFDVCLIDLHMQNMHGSETAQFIVDYCSHYDLEKPKLVLSSADVFAEEEEDGSLSGLFSQILCKPIPKQDLERLCENVVTEKMSKK